MEIYIDVNMIAANSPKETVKNSYTKRSFPSLNTYILYMEDTMPKNPSVVI